MAELLKCVFCDNSGEKLILFSEETLKKCRTILELRKKHNLKFKDITLPVDLYESGYHRQCYKSFTGLMKKYYESKGTNAAKSTSKEKTSNVTDPQLPISQPSSPAAALLPDPSTTSEPTVITDVIKPVPSTSQDNSAQRENVYSTTESNISVEEEIISNFEDLSCIFCSQKTKKHKSKRQSLFSTDKEKFLSKFQANPNATEIINKVANYSQQKVHYHHC